MDSTQSEGAGRARVVLDLFRADVDPSGLADALECLSRQVQGVTLLSDIVTVDAPGQPTTVVKIADPGSASRLQRCEAVLPQDAELVIYGDARLLDPAWQGAMTDVRARWVAGDTALIRGCRSSISCGGSTVADAFGSAWSEAVSSDLPNRTCCAATL